MPVIEAQRASILVPHDHRHINHEYAFVYCYCSSCVGFEPRGTEVVSCGQARGGVQGGRQVPQQAMAGSVPPSSVRPISPVVVSAPGRAGDAEARRARLVIDGLAEGKRLADGDPLRIPQAVPAGRPSGCGSRSSHLPFEVSMAEVVSHRGADGIR